MNDSNEIRSLSAKLFAMFKTMYDYVSYFDMIKRKKRRSTKRKVLSSNPGLKI